MLPGNSRSVEQQDIKIGGAWLPVMGCRHVLASTAGPQPPYDKEVAALAAGFQAIIFPFELARVMLSFSEPGAWLKKRSCEPCELPRGERKEFARSQRRLARLICSLTPIAEFVPILFLAI